MTDPNLDRRKVWWAVLASIAAHFLIGLSLAAFGGASADIALEEQQAPPQLTIMQPPRADAAAARAEKRADDDR